jgi:cytoskeletal protein CcmA (bactofilin family)
MKRRVSRAALAVLVLVAVSGCSVHYDGEDSVTREFGSDYFGAGGMLNLTEPVEGDALLAGGHVATASEVRGDLVAAGGEVSVGGAIGDDLYAAGGSVQFDAVVNGNARVAGGDISVGPATIVAGGLSLTGGQVEFEGVAQEYLRASGGSVHLDGEVVGDAEVRAKELLIGPNARIGGRLVYHGPSEPTVAEGAVISGGLEYHAEDAGRYFQGVQPAVRDAATSLGTFLWFVGVFVAGALFVLLLPGFTSESAAAIGRKPLPSLGLGLAILLCVPFVALVLLITIIGIPVALLLMSLYLLVLFLGWITAALFVAQRGLAALRPGRPVTRGWQLLALLLGLVVLWLLQQIPLVGGWIGFLALLAGIGALTWRAFNGRQATVTA